MAVLLLTNLVSFRSKCEVVTLCTWPPTKQKDCLRATDLVRTGSVTQRSITLAYNGLHLPHSRTKIATSRKAEHEQRVKARVKSPWYALSYCPYRCCFRPMHVLTGHSWLRCADFQRRESQRANIEQCHMQIHRPGRDSHLSITLNF